MVDPAAPLPSAPAPAPVAPQPPPGAQSSAAGATVPPTADEKQAAQAKKLTADERKAADKAAALAKKTEMEKHHAERIKRGHEQNKLMSDKLWVGTREVKIVRKAADGDIDFIETEACSVIAFADTGEERVVQDKDIQTSPAIVP